MIFPLTPMLNFQSATKFWKLVKKSPIVKKSNSLYPLGSQYTQKVWLTLDENYRSSLLKCPAPYEPVLTKIPNCDKLFNIRRSAKHSNRMYSPLIIMLLIKFGWIRWSLWLQQPLEDPNIRNFAKRTEWPPNWTQRTRPARYPTYGTPRTVSPKISSVSLYGQP